MKTASMNMNYALNLLNIQHFPVSKQQVKQAYKSQAKKYHPDINPTGETMMQALNAAHERLLDCEFPIESMYKQGVNHDLSAIYSDTIAKLQDLPASIIVELKGAWLWVSGDTKPFKETLKEVGCRWHSKKKQWYFYDYKQPRFRSFSRGAMTSEEITERYGSKHIRTGRNALTA